jgi:hypothetical protein
MGKQSLSFLYIGYEVRNVIVGVTTTECSRNNAPSRPDSIYDMVKKHLPKKQDVLLVVFVEKAQYIFALVSAIARAFPLYK